MLPRFVWAPDTVFTLRGPVTCSTPGASALSSPATATEGKGAAESLRPTRPRASPARPTPVLGSQAASIPAPLPQPGAHTSIPGVYGEAQFRVPEISHFDDGQAGADDE